MIERFNQIERRFVIPQAFAEVALWSFNSREGRSYSVGTNYVDRVERTWSALDATEELAKMRIRTYNDKESFFEHKIHESRQYTRKERNASDGLTPAGFISLGTTSYERTEYVIEGTRVTVDRFLRVNETTYDFVIVEVKGEFPSALNILKPFENKKFSKWKLASGRWNPEQK